MKRSSKALLAFVAWVLVTLVLAPYHEPWRDEAQAWLVVKNSLDLKQLFYFSSQEASGPLYYLMLRPFRAFDFPLMHFFVSWLGAALCVGLVLFSRLMPFGWALAFSFSYLLGYEFSTIARLYGWGLSFVFLAIYFDKKEKDFLSGIFFAACILLQLSISWAALIGVLYALFRRGLYSWLKTRPYTLILITLATFSALAHMQLAASVREWVDWRVPDRLSIIGSTLSVPFIQGWGAIGYGGVLVYALAVWALPSRSARAAFLMGSLAISLVFIFHYSNYAGAPQARHGAALFLVWLLLMASEIQISKKWAASFLSVVFVSSMAAMLKARVEDYLYPYSDGKGAALAIQARPAYGPQSLIFTPDEVYGFVVSAYLNKALLAGLEMNEVLVPQFTRQASLRRQRENRIVSWERYAKSCKELKSCYVVQRGDWPTVPDDWLPLFKEIYTPSLKTLSDERLRVYELVNP